MAGVSGVTGAAPIWHDFMRAVLRGTPAQSFPRPEGLVRVEICGDSGLLPEGNGKLQIANQQIANQQSQMEIVACPHRRAEWFIAGTEPVEADRSHVRVAVDAHTGMAATDATPAEFVVERVFWLLPDEYREWARAQGIEQPADLTPGPSPDRRGEAADLIPDPFPAGRRGSAPPPSLAEPVLGLPKEQGAGGAGVVLTSPDPNRAYRIDPGLPLSAQKLPITARLDEEAAGRLAEGAAVTLLVDGATLAVVAGPDYTAWWPLTTGLHTFEAIVAAAYGTHIRSAAVNVLVE